MRRVLGFLPDLLDLLSPHVHYTNCPSFDVLPCYPEPNNCFSVFIVLMICAVLLCGLATCYCGNTALSPHPVARSSKATLENVFISLSFCGFLYFRESSFQGSSAYLLCPFRANWQNAHKLPICASTHCKAATALLYRARKLLRCSPSQLPLLCELKLLHGRLDDLFLCKLPSLPYSRR